MYLLGHEKIINLYHKVDFRLSFSVFVYDTLSEGTCPFYVFSS